MTHPDPRSPDGTGSTEPRRPDPTPDADTGAHAVRPGGPSSSTFRPAPGSTSSDRGHPEPPGPHTTGPGGHVLGVLVGLAVTVVALLVLALGMSRILAGGIGAETVGPDALGIALVTVGALLVAIVALLAIRTSAAPFTGGLVALLVGAAYLFAPEASHRETVRLLATEQNRDAVLNASTVGTSGTFFTIGLVLLAAGNAASIIRRRGIEIGSYRERTAARTGRER